MLVSDARNDFSSADNTNDKTVLEVLDIFHCIRISTRKRNKALE